MPLKTTDVIFRKGKSVRVTRIKAKRGLIRRNLQGRRVSGGSKPPKREIWKCRRCAGSTETFGTLHALLAHARVAHGEPEIFVKRKKRTRRWNPKQSADWYGAQFDKYVIPPERICDMDGRVTWSGIFRTLSAEEIKQLVDQVNKGGRVFCKACADKTPALPGEELCQFHQAK